MRLVVDVTPLASTLVSSIVVPAEDLTPASDRVSYGNVASRLPPGSPRGPLRWTGSPESTAAAGQRGPLSRLSVDIAAGASPPARNEPFFPSKSAGESRTSASGGVCSFLFVEVVGGSGLAEDFSATARRLLLLFILAPAATNNCGSGIFVQRTINSKMPGEALRTLRWLSRSPGGLFARPETTTVCVSSREVFTDLLG